MKEGKRTNGAGLARQHAALCYRRAGGEACEILLVTSRDTGRWVLPKGWPKKKEEGGASALREAHEEAGVIGRLIPGEAGAYSYDKAMPAGAAIPCRVLVHAVEVNYLSYAFPEMGIRRREWFSPEAASIAVAEPELKSLLADFRPPSETGAAAGKG
ncbi:NUDIX hydrolase [Frigidibacter sp. RF13]|uniref:NUDIX hydrolase n=1 Tax=Frigidibacter sp. RF13 TaxID=2997340 RepID=UPI00226EDD09|nr:NUDIX hydrolase [Frigidibacter sp. RF13]MCY1126282.1 NUDIX hydrolase [Frigidibacter sp. RF13]